MVKPAGSCVMIACVVPLGIQAHGHGRLRRWLDSGSGELGASLMCSSSRPSSCHDPPACAARPPQAGPPPPHATPSCCTAPPAQGGIFQQAMGRDTHSPGILRTACQRGPQYHAASRPRRESRGEGPEPHLQRLAVSAVEVALRPQEAGHEEVKQRPQLEHAVLDGRAAQDEPAGVR